MSAYLLCFGGLLLLGGRCADLLGRRRVFMVGVGLFVSSSLMCGLAWSPAALTGARVLQGVSAAVMAPTALSVLMTVFPDGPERNRAPGIWGGIGGIGATAGLLLGGPVTAAFGWQGFSSLTSRLAWPCSRSAGRCCRKAPTRVVPGVSILPVPRP
jgi:MFS family permease